jgi:small-conductance mechanosensitive channel
MEKELSQIISEIINSLDGLYPLLLGVGAIVLLAILKDEIRNLFKGIAFRLDVDFQEDDIVILEGRKAMITKIGLLKTKVMMLDKNTIRKFNNSNMEKLKLEKILRKFPEEEI